MRGTYVGFIHYLQLVLVVVLFTLMTVLMGERKTGKEEDQHGFAAWQTES